MRFVDLLNDQRIVRPQRFIQKPLISVIMPTYCRAHDGFLARAIRSVLNQTFSDFEFIIMDDGSIDGSQDIILEFQKQDDRILYVRHEVNSGLPALRADEAIILSRADHIAVQTDDDEWLGPFLHTALKEAVARSAPLVHCQAEWLRQGRIYRSPFPVVQPTYLSLLQGNKIGHNSALIHKSVLQSVGLYDPHVILRRYTDWDFWLRVTREFVPCMIPEVLVRVYGELPDSIGVRVPTIEYEDFISVVVRRPQNASLKPENIRNYDVTSLDRYLGAMPTDAVDSLYRNVVCPWLAQHERKLEGPGVSIDEIAGARQEKPAACATGTKAMINKVPPEKAAKKRTLLCRDLILAKEKLSSSIAGVQQFVVKLLRPYPPLMRVAQISYRLACSIIVRLQAALHDAYNSLPADFKMIRDDPQMLDYRRRGFMLTKSRSLQEVPFLSYELTAEEGDFSAVALRLAVQPSEARGVVGVDLVYEDNQIATSAMMPVFCVSPDKPAEFFFEPPLKAGKYWIKVFGKGLGAPVQVFEFKRCTVANGRITGLFCGFVLP